MLKGLEQAEGQSRGGWGLENGGPSQQGDMWNVRRAIGDGLREAGPGTGASRLREEAGFCSECHGEPLEVP